jgi:hydroxymethylbilane synthase
VTVRADDTELHELLAAIEDPEAKAVSTAERALLAELDGSCRTPIGGYARLLPYGELRLTGLVARADGSFLLKRALLAALDGSCRTPIGGYARLLPNGDLHLTALVARPDGSFLLKRHLHGPAGDAARIGAELAASLRADSPRDIFGDYALDTHDD